MIKPECKIEYSPDCDFIIGVDNREWMQISTADNNVTWKIFPRNIPKEYIGEKAPEQEEITNTLICETQETADDCRGFIADFINRGYGEKFSAGDGWLVALDLQDIAGVLSEGMRYCKLECDSKDASDTVFRFFEKVKVKDAKGVLMCVYCEENALSIYNGIIEALYDTANKNCVIMQQCVVDKALKNQAVVHIFCS